MELPFFKVSDMNLPGNEQVMRAWNNSVSRNTADRLKAAILPAGTIIFPKVGGALLTNKRRVLERPSCVDNNIMCCVVQRGDIDFVRYLFDNIDLGMIAKPGPLPAVNERDVKDIRVPFPPLPEQRAIAAYLDRKGAIARRYAHVARHIIDTLRELRQVEIHDAVTRGLNEDIPLKPSGVEWLRDVPEHWDVCQVKRKYAIRLGKMLQNYPKRETDIAVPYLKVPNVQWAGVSAADAQTMWASPRDIERYSIRKGDLLVCEGGEGGRCAILEEEPPPNCIIQNALHRVRPLRDDSNAYLKYTMNAIDTMGWFDAINNKATIAHFTVEKFSTLFIPNPPIAEQRAIAEYLDAKTAAIDAAIAHYERMAELVAEYWTVLVADAVTGRIDLRQADAE